MPIIRSLTVLPALPEPLKDLDTIARNLYWSWQPRSKALFERIDPQLWRECGHNPIRLLGTVSQQRLEALAGSQGFLHLLSQAKEELRSYLKGPTWFQKVCGGPQDPLIAYFSAEFGLHECLPLYAGGLGILAADHLKSASDLGVPIVGVGLFYHKGYFRQQINIDGWQQEVYQDYDPYTMPMDLVRTEGGSPLTVGVEYPGRTVWVQIWSVAVGRAKLFLLDTNIPANCPADRMITSTLYGGDRELRIRQEICLGIGGVRALAAMGLEPTVYHMNEGHAAFMALERIRILRQKANLDFDQAAEITKASNVFTLHTLVKAGLDEFSVELMDKYFADYILQLGLTRTQFLSLGRMLPDDDSEPFKMPVLAMKLSGYVNGVSKLHAEVSRGVWGTLWPGLPADEVPIKAITNGVHLPTWVAPPIAELYEQYIGPGWSETVLDSSGWEGIYQVPDIEIWSAHQRCKKQLIQAVREALRAQMARRGACRSDLQLAHEALDPDVLTIGFARRFAGYKRGDLLLRDQQRLQRLVTDPNTPIQIVYAGKAHPRDNEGKEIIRNIVRFASSPQVRRRIAFLEDYDMHIARLLVQGVDVWLNNPRRPMEASGTSGMKAAANGVLNLSTLDGWWCEGYCPQCGWAISPAPANQPVDYQDQLEAQAIFELLEREVIPLFYTRGSDNLPRAWIQRMKHTIRHIAPRFSTHRIVAEYVRRFYNPAAARWRHLTSDQLERAKALVQWKANLRNRWQEMAICDVQIALQEGQGPRPLDPRQPQIRAGSRLNVKTLVRLGQILPTDVSVELYYGPLDSWGNIRQGRPIPMQYQMPDGQPGTYWFSQTIGCDCSGRQGLAIRILPNNPDLCTRYEPGLILWEGSA
ncbi:MAG: alpha-glucan family phosphorylase [Sedimentisphaerales bacterium]|jgi:starch phosphorylase|nr:alpha-glucan family phosphorylase [Sedimentisphaerales bacterium]